MARVHVHFFSHNRKVKRKREERKRKKGKEIGESQQNERLNKIDLVFPMVIKSCLKILISEPLKVLFKLYLERQEGGRW